MIHRLYQYAFADGAQPGPGSTASGDAWEATPSAASEGSCSTFASDPKCTALAGGSRLLCSRDLPASPMPQAPRPASSTGSCSPLHLPDALRRTCTPLPRSPWVSDPTADLPRPFLTALTFLSVNGAQDWAPTAALFLARYAFREPELAAQPGYTGVRTAAALLVATKLIEGRRCKMKRFVPIADLIMQRTGTISFDAQDPVGYLKTLEGRFLHAIGFSISAPRHTVAWYAQEIASYEQACAEVGGSLEDPPVRQAIAKGFPDAARASLTHEPAL